MTTTQQQSLRGTHDAGCAEQIRVRELVRAGEPAKPDVVVLHRIAEQIRACCGIDALKAHRRAWGWTVERAVERFHAMCVDQGLGARGLVVRSWQGWEAGDYSPNDDYRDLLCRLFQTSAVRLGFASDHTPPQVAAAGCVCAADDNDGASVEPSRADAGPVGVAAGPGVAVRVAVSVEAIPAMGGAGAYGVWVVLAGPLPLPVDVQADAVAQGQGAAGMDGARVYWLAEARRRRGGRVG